MSAPPYIDADRDAILRWINRAHTGPVVMLNLLRFRETADYSKHPELAPPAPISGVAAYDRYVEHTTPFIRAAGSRLIAMGDGAEALIGPREPVWDKVLLVEHASVPAFLSFATNAGYVAGLGHRTAALADSRLIPIHGWVMPD